MSFPTISSIKSNNAQVRQAGAAARCMLLPVEWLTVCSAAAEPTHLARCPLPPTAPLLQEHEQGSVQGALYGARALASGTGPLVFAGLFSAFTKTESPLPYFPGAPFMFGTLLMLVAIGVASTIPSTAGGSGGSIERGPATPAGNSGRSSSCDGGECDTVDEGVPGKAGVGGDWPARELAAESIAGSVAAVSGRPGGAGAAADLEGGGGSGGGGAANERSRLLG